MFRTPHTLLHIIPRHTTTTALLTAAAFSPPYSSATAPIGFDSSVSVHSSGCKARHTSQPSLYADAPGLRIVSEMSVGKKRRKKKEKKKGRRITFAWTPV